MDSGKIYPKNAPCPLYVVVQGQLKQVRLGPDFERGLENPIRELSS